jgi:hypothetical protein
MGDAAPSEARKARSTKSTKGTKNGACRQRRNSGHARKQAPAADKYRQEYFSSANEYMGNSVKNSYTPPLFQITARFGAYLRGESIRLKSSPASNSFGRAWQKPANTGH